MYHLPLEESVRGYAPPLWHAGSNRFTGSSKNVYKTLQGCALPDQKAMREMAAEDMSALGKEHTGEQQGPEVMPTVKQLQMPATQLLAFEQVRGVHIPHNCCLRLLLLSDIQVQ